MEIQYHFNSTLYWKRYRPHIIFSWLVSIIFDFILLLELNSISKDFTIDQIGQIFGKNSIIFLIIINTLFLKVFVIWIWLYNRRMHRNGCVKFIRDYVVHLDKVARLSRFQTRLRLAVLAGQSKKRFDIINQYRILQIQKVSKNRWGDLILSGQIERQWIDESLDLSPDLDWNSDQKIIISTHRIPNYYENMDDLEQNLGKMVK